MSGAGTAFTRRRDRAADTADRGAVLPMAIVMVVVMSIIVVGLLNFTSTVLRARPPLEERNAGVVTASSAMRLGVMLQIANGPGGCIEQADFPAESWEFNEFDTEFSCEVLNYADTGRSRFAVVTTQTTPASGAIVGATSPSPSNFLKEIDGNVFINGGELVTRTQDLAIAGTNSNPLTVSYSNSVAAPLGLTGTAPSPQRYSFSGAAPVDCDVAAAGPDGIAYDVPSQIWTGGDNLVHLHAACSGGPSVSWWDRAGDDLNPLDGVDSWVYPVLPQVPTWSRNGSYVDLSPTCRLLYPGRYTDPVVLDGTGGRRFFLASGLYYFTAPLTITNGAQVVAGEGRISGCGLDADLALHPTALTNHGITGKGATLIFGATGRLELVRSSLQINRRVSTPTTRGSEGMSIRTVNGGTFTPNLQIPTDRVQQGEYPCVEASVGVCAVPFSANRGNQTLAVPVTSHQMLLPSKPTPTAVTYAASTLAATDRAVLIDFTGSTNQATSRFEVDGYVFTPNAQVEVLTPTGGAHMSKYTVLVNSGVVASSIRLNVPTLPTNPQSNWYFGVNAQPVQLRVGLTARVTSPGGTRSIAKAIVEVGASGAYAVNSWTVDPNTEIEATTTLPPPSTTTLPPTTTTTTLPPTTTTTTLPPTTTTTPPTSTTSTTSTTTTTTTTTTLPPTTTTTLPPSATCPSTTVWKEEFFNNKTLTNPRVLCRNNTNNSINYDWGSGSPQNGTVSSNNFSARFTRSVNLSNGTYDFEVTADDGVRVWVNGTLRLDKWYDQGATTYTFSVNLSGPTTIVMEYYENGGNAVAKLKYTRR
jgi:hypothetical protein